MRTRLPVDALVCEGTEQTAHTVGLDPSRSTGAADNDARTCMKSAHIADMERTCARFHQSVNHWDRLTENGIGFIADLNQGAAIVSISHNGRPASAGSATAEDDSTRAHAKFALDAEPAGR